METEAKRINSPLFDGRMDLMDEIEGVRGMVFKWTDCFISNTVSENNPKGSQ